MAIGIHFANIGFLMVDQNGQVIPNKSTEIKNVLNSSHEHRIIEDSNNPNSIGYPTIKGYLELEAASNYILQHLDQYNVITYNQTDINNA